MVFMTFWFFEDLQKSETNALTYILKNIIYKGFFEQYA